MRLNRKKKREFTLWAVGRPDGKFSVPDFVNLWNKKHSDLLTLYLEGFFISDCKKTMQLWKKHKNKYNCKKIK